MEETPKKRGRPKGSVKLHKKYHKNFRLSADEDKIITSFLKAERAFNKGAFPSFDREQIFDHEIKLKKIDETDELFFIFTLRDDKFIFKSKIKQISKFTYTIQKKEDWEFLKKYTEFKINKNTLLVNSSYLVKDDFEYKNTVHKAYTSYEAALQDFLHMEKFDLLGRVITENNLFLYRTYITKNRVWNDETAALEFVARYFNMEYIFDKKYC